MDQVEVEITGLAITQRYGALSTGTVLRTDAAYADHLVNEAHCAKFVKVEAPASAPAPAAARARKTAAESKD